MNMKKSNLCPGLQMACNRSRKNKCKISQNQLEVCKNLTSVESTILNSACKCKVFASASLGFRLSGCGDGAKIRENRKGLEGGG